MNKITLAIVFLLASLPIQSLACSPILPSEAIGRDADRVLIGVTTGNSRKSKNFYEALVDIKITEILKGQTANTVTAISPCSLPFKKGEKVVVVSINHQWIVYSADFYEKPIRAGARGGR